MSINWNKELGIRNYGRGDPNSSFIIHNSKPEDFPKTMLVDMNSFFASVEQQANPFFRNKPLGVCASLHETSCIIAASKEAKAIGIKTGTLIYKAKKIYPKIILVQSEPEKYREVSRRINAIFREYSDRVESYSIDESFIEIDELRITNYGLETQKSAICNLQFKNPLLVGAKIKRRILDEVGEYLTCSVGIGPNKFMAKLAADLVKPDGLTVVWRSNLPEIYKRLKFSDLWGVAGGWTNRLNRLGIQNPSEMLKYPVGNLLAVFGKPGFHIWQRICGLEIDELRITDYGLEQSAIRNPQSNNPKSFGHSWVLNFRTTDRERLKVVVMRLAEKAARRMRHAGFQACGIYLSVTDVGRGHFHISKKLKKPINTSQELYMEAMNLWNPWKFTHEIMHVAVGFTNLLTDCLQLDLFGDRKPALIQTLDRINDRYGEFTVRSGLLTHTSDFAPDAIAFGK